MQAMILEGIGYIWLRRGYPELSHVCVEEGEVHGVGWTLVSDLLPGLWCFLAKGTVQVEEVLDAWPRSKEAIIVSVSHAWEAREHPDPCGYQLERVAQHASLFAAAFVADIWLFFDYVSLFQFKREKEAEEQSFRRSMGNMHAMYAHESTVTFRLESLTPEQRWQKAVKDGSQVTIFHFHDTSGLVEPVPLQALTRNTNAYLDRGWCRAELSWSSGRGDTAQNQRIDVGSRVIDMVLTGRMPVAPDVFAADMDSAAFTHRSDADAVIELQKKVFLEKVTRRRKLKLEGVSLDQMQALTQSLRHFEQLKSIMLIDFRCRENEAKAFVEAGFLLPTSWGESTWVCSTHYSSCDLCSLHGMVRTYLEATEIMSKVATLAGSKIMVHEVLWKQLQTRYHKADANQDRNQNVIQGCP